MDSEEVGWRYWYIIHSSGASCGLSCGSTVFGIKLFCI